MYRTFNCGIGMVVVIAEEDADAVQAFLTEQGETVYRLAKSANATVTNIRPKSLKSKT